MYVASLFLTQDFPSDYEKKESYVPFFHAKFTLKDNQMINNHVFIMLSLLPLSSIQIFIQSIVLYYIVTTTIITFKLVRNSKSNVTF